MKTKPFKIEDCDKNKKIIIYGASVYGELAYRGLKAAGISPTFFCDQSNQRDIYLGIKAISPQQLGDYVNDNIIIASADFFFEIREKLESIGCKNLFDMRYLLKENLDIESLSNRAQEMYANRQHYIDIVSHQDENKIIFNRIQYVITEKCTLRCKDCSHLIPYYREPENINIQKYKRAFNLLIEQIDYLAELRILGGEPFLSKDMEQLVLDYYMNPKIEQISVYTNGTVIPSDNVIKALKKGKVKVHISNYVINEEKIKRLTAILEKNKIRYFVRKYDAWQESGGVDYRGYTDEQLERKFGNCFERNGYTFLKGRLYRCPRVAHAINLKAIPDLSGDYIDLQNWNSGVEQLKMQINALQNKQWLRGCNYCEGPDNHTQSIPAALQCRRNIPYTRLGE